MLALSVLASRVGDRCLRQDRPMAKKAKKAARIRWFSQSNPLGPGQEDVPALLRRVARSLEKLGKTEVQDVVFHTDEITDDARFWPSMTVYYYRG